MRGIDNDQPGTVGVWRKSGRCVGLGEFTTDRLAAATSAPIPNLS